MRKNRGLLEIRVHKHKRRVNCVGKFSVVSGHKLRPCLDRVFVPHPEPKLQQK